MTEEEPLVGEGGMEPTRVPLTGPNVLSTFDSPPSPDARRAHDAAIRRHLRAHPSSPKDPPEKD